MELLSCSTSVEVAVLSCLCSIRLALQQVTAAKLRDAARKRKVDGTKVPPSSVTACLAFLQLELCACDRGRRSHAGLNGAEQLNLKQGQRRRDLSSTQTSRSNRLRQELSGSIPVAGRQRTKCKSLYIEIQGTAPASPQSPQASALVPAVFRRLQPLLRLPSMQLH